MVDRLTQGVLYVIAAICGKLGHIVLETLVDRCLAYVVESDVAFPTGLAKAVHILVIGNLEGEAVTQLLCDSALAPHADEDRIHILKY